MERKGPSRATLLLFTVLVSKVLLGDDRPRQLATLDIRKAVLRKHFKSSENISAKTLKEVASPYFKANDFAFAYARA